MNSEFGKILERTQDQIVFNLNAIQNQKGTCQVLLILNNILNQCLLEKLILKCENIILADGGSNRLYDSRFRDCGKVRMIIGDLDSLRPEVKKYYEERGTKVIKAFDQNYCDMQKSLRIILQHGWKNIICIGALQGRLDHTLSNMSIATKICRLNSSIQIVLFGRTSLMFFIRKNFNNIVLLSPKVAEQGIGLITFDKVNHVQTKGFKWNMGQKEAFSQMEWGKFISTSNKAQSDKLFIRSSQDIFFVCDIIN